MFKKILVPLDGSRMAEAVLPLARDLAACNDARIIVLHVNTPLAAQYYAPEMYSMVAEMEQAARTESNAYLHHILANLLDRGLRASAELVDANTAAEAILDYADHYHVDLIAMSTHGRTGVGRWLMGSVADKVVHGARMAVLFVRPDESKSA